MAFLTAGFIDGSMVKGETLRRALWASTGGASGVTDVEALKVVALGTPGGAVLIQPGGGIVPTAYATAPGIQSYVVSNDAAHSVSIPANSSGSVVTWQIIVRVRDPQYAGESVPANPQTDSYTTPEAVAALPTGKPYLWLATVAVPANTAAITNAMITDRRTLAMERTKIELARMRRPTVNNDMFYSYGAWPTETAIGANKQAYVAPKWASMAVLKVTAAGVYMVGTAPVYGGIRVKFNGAATDHAILYAEGTPNRVTTSGTWNFTIPDNLRGTTVEFELEGMNSSGSPRIIRADNQTQFTWELTWAEKI